MLDSAFAASFARIPAAFMVDQLRVTFLGTGTSSGIPVLTCRCDVCTSPDPRNRRLRAGLHLSWPRPDGAASVLIDTPTDLREQALRASIDRVDAVVYTHAHADHVLGLDELRIYNFVHKRPIPLFADAPTRASLLRMFPYAFDPNGVGVPRLHVEALEPVTEVCGLEFAAVPLPHGPGTTQALRIGGFAYATDCSAVPDVAAERLQGLDVLVLDALRREPHRSHLSLEQALEQIERLAPGRAYLTHLCHDLEHEAVERELPENVRIAYDGLQIVIDLPGPRP